MPVWDPNANAIFGQALECATPAERQAFCDQACGDDRDLRQKVEQLLASHRDAGSFLDTPAFADDWTPSPIVEGPGDAVGPYKLLQQIGEGGMGVVFMAGQERPVRRTVALKIIKPGLDSQNAVARFAAERQALAMMDHPSIARVLDAGSTSSGRLYFAMDLVKGVPITEYCDARRLTLRQRLELFIPVCQAVQHAHQKGVIHRDIKPSNVLVAEYDGKPVPKVIDFGVAKAIGQPLTQDTLFTQYGQIIGTFEYMSPEQATFNQLDADTRSDIYSLGVLLYELLAGSTPIEKQRLRSAPFDEVLKIIREEEPPKPSTRISSSEKLPAIAIDRGTEQARLKKEIRGDLDWIVMRCLEKDRNGRYETADALALDLQRYLNNEPVLACPPSLAYRFRKFTRRYCGALLAVAIVLVALVCGIAVSTWQAVRATRAERDAVAQRDAREVARREAMERQKEAEQARVEEAQARQEAEAVVEFLVRAFQSPHPLRAGREVRVADVLDHAEMELEKEFAGQPLIQATLLDAIGRSRAGLGLSRGSIDALSRALEIRKNVLGANHPDTLDSMSGLASAYRAARQQDKAIALYEQTLSARRATLGEDHPDTLSSLRALASIYHAVGRRDEALNLYKESLATAGELKKSTSNDSDTPQTMANRGVTFRDVQHTDEADQLKNQLLQHGFFAASVGLASRFPAEEMNNLMEVAIAYSGEQTPSALDAVVLGELRLTAGALKSAEVAFRSAIARGETRPFVYKSLGLCLTAQGRVDEARKAFEQALNHIRQPDGSFRLADADPDEMTAAYFLGLIPERDFISHTASDERLACFPWYYVGQRREIEGDQQAAIAAYKQCVELGNNETAHSVRALARWRLGQLTTNIEGSD